MQQARDNAAMDSELHITHSGSGWVTMLVFVLLVVIAGLFLIDRLYHPQKFRIEQIEVRGQFRHVNAEQVRDIVEETLRGNYFSVSLEEVESAVGEMAWIFSAAVRRQWPSTLVVEVEEVQPIAEWGENQWLNASGDLVRREPWDHKLPMLFGPESMKESVWQKFQKWHGMFASHGLSLDRLEFDERELWYLDLSLSALARDRNLLTTSVIDSSATRVVDAEPGLGEVTMIVDNSEATARIARLINALNSQLIAEFPGMKSIDLRYPNGFAINWIQRSPETRKLTESK